jgi:two-component system, OmpR family, response regulator BaeR
MSAQTVLVVEDDRKVAQVLVEYLRYEGYVAESVFDGEAALKAIRAKAPSALILDLMLPGLDGLTLCRAVRSFSHIPILMLTARVDEVDRLLGLDSGADDYVCKPFSPREVMARIRAMLRRSQGQLVSSESKWTVDETGLRIACRGRWLSLTQLEFRILRRLIEHPGHVFAREQLLDAAHADMRDVNDRAVDTHIKNIRRKLQQVEAGPGCIVSVYGVGYKFDEL